ncbi:PQQ-binding-like beta-propeller repeat protein [Falsiroseomonas sp. HW251]|uniref:outer membrane protein assembly factor BamB family protein n=1 Tax=Falsiroseomonas sp. HW251 TaxID=3390998 RepID=UPI003D316990
MNRRALLLGSAGLLSGCGTFDDIFGERKVRLPGERISVLQSEASVTADADSGPVTLPGPQPVSEWPTVGGPASHAPGHVQLGVNLAQAWRASAGSGSGYRQRMVAGPVIGNGTVYAVDAWGSVSAHRLADGSRVWRTDSTPDDQWASPLGGGAAFADGTLYVATGLAEVIAMNAANGEIKWRVRLPAPARGAPGIAGGRIFVPTNENQLYALSVEDGSRLWNYRAQSVTTMALGLPAPAVDGDAVVAGFTSGELFALRVTDGRVLWGESLGSLAMASIADFVGITGLPVIVNGRVIAVGLGNTSIAVDLRTGRRLWERNFGGGAGPATAGDFAFAVTRDGEALAIGREDGRVHWVTPLDPPPATGSRRGTPPRFGRPLVANGRLMIPSSRSEFLLLDPANGQIAGRMSTGYSITLPMAVTDGTLVALADDGTLVAFR